MLLDAEGHVRLIDMGLAARFTHAQPRRTSRVGTECYMAPEVRFARRRRQPYGVSADWRAAGRTCRHVEALPPRSCPRGLAP